MLQPHDQTNFTTLARAFIAGDVALLEVQRIADGAIVGAICTVGYEHDVYVLTPFATMIEGDPFKHYNPPHSDGGFFSQSTVES